MKKVLSVITLDISAECFIGDQLAFFQSQGDFECHLICSPSLRLDEFAQKQGITLFPVLIERRPSIWKDIKAFFAILNYMRKNRFDVLIAHSFPKACLLSMTAGYLAAIPHRIELAHGALQEGLKGIMRRFVILSERHNSRLAEIVICVSESVARRRRNDGIDKPSKQILLSKGTSNGIDTVGKFNPHSVASGVVDELKGKLGLEKPSFVIGYIGRLVRDKGIVELIDGFVKLREMRPDQTIKLLIVGNPERRDALPEETLDFIDNCPDIVFSGPIPYDIIQIYYLLMDVFILPSYREGFPTVVLEASAMERPVITTRKTGCVDSIVEGKTGVYTELDSDSIANSLQAFLDPEYAKTIGKNGRKWVVENFDHAIVREAMFDLIKECCK